jgi:glycine cleavage system H protein
MLLEINADPPNPKNTVKTNQYYRGNDMSYPNECHYHKEHTWLILQPNDEALIGITFFAQDTLGDIVELGGPPKGSMVSCGVSCGTVESRKTVSDLISPATGVVLEVNENLRSEPFMLNDDPYGKGWIVRIKLSNLGEIEMLMSAEEYRKNIGE